LTTSPLPTLEDLRNAPHSAWLWDGVRGRIVWANQAGIKLFDCQSVFDLIDRPFDIREPGIETIAELTHSLKRGETCNALLHFPSVGLITPLACSCNLHSLADGRAGLLVVAAKPAEADQTLDPQFAISAFLQMPVAVAFVSRNGDISHKNACAAQMFDSTSLGQFMASAERAEEFLKRLQSISLVSQIETIAGRLGQREVRLTLQKMSADDAAYAMMILDDITERRNIERQINAEPSIAQGTKSYPDQAFEVLARTLKDTIQEDTRLLETASKATPQPAKQPPPVPVPQAKAAFDLVPKTISNALEQTGAAIAILKDNKPVFVSKKAIDLIGYESAQAMLTDDVLWGSLVAHKSTNSEMQLLIGDGRYILVHVRASSIPWLSGPAQQFIFEAPKSNPVESLVVAKKPARLVPDAETIPIEIVVPALQPIATAETLAIDDDLRRILDIASDGIATLDREGRILSLSAGAEAIFGYRIAEVFEKSLADLLSPESRKLFNDYLSGLESPGLAAVFNDGREMTAVVKQGGSVPIFFTLGRLHSETSKAAYAAVMRDITSWKRTEKELRLAKDVAEEASRQKSEFLARISHELRTPLNAIIGFSEVMRLGQFGDIKNDKYRGYINDIHASGGYLLSLINDLLDLSKIEAGKMELNFTAVSVGDATEHAVRLLQDVATRGRVLVRRSFAEKLPRVVADLRALRQIMLNVLSNAIKFTDPGGQVIISAQITRDGELALSIKDTGIGMNAAQIKEALEPFKRVETVGRETQGTGLGLSLTKALVEANRAKFELSSEPGHGTLIEIVFPTTRVLAE
jgi:PAS domain S-box-containing protein